MTSARRPPPPRAGGPSATADPADQARSPAARLALGALARELATASLVAPVPSISADLQVSGVQQDSRRVEPGDLFVALQGQHVDGAAYLSAAAERGAVAVLHERGRSVDPHGLIQLESDEPRLAMARAAALVYGRPTEQLQVVGITGTNGKTTTLRLVEHCIQAAGGRCGSVGTLAYRFESLELPASHTSPEADELQRVAAAMLGRGASHLIMEVSSIALAAERVREVRFEVAAFTNLTQDHLDYHRSMQAYAAAKDRLFFELDPQVAVVNIDDPHGADLAGRLAARSTGRLRQVSADAAADADVRATDVQLDASGIRMTVRTPGGGCQIRAPLVGAHNVANLLCTVAIVDALGLDLERAAQALSSAPGVPGRLERCDLPGQDDLIAVVDYAHTPDALARSLQSVRAFTQGELWCVFGCGGDRDQGKRGPMGEAVGQSADHAIVTNDNPRSEDPSRIAGAIVEGLVTARGRYEVELDRARAIELAITRAAPGDVVLVAGKGHEPYQIIGELVASFDDRVQVRCALERRRARKGS